jgi:transposase InsO family protein
VRATGETGNEPQSRPYGFLAQVRHHAEPAEECLLRRIEAGSDECLNEHWFSTLDEARAVIEAWRQDYNRVRPHSSLGYLTPMEYVEKISAKNLQGACPLQSVDGIQLPVYNPGTTLLSAGLK